MSRTFYKACLYVFIGNSMITKTILRLFTYVNGKGPTYKRATHFYLAWKEGKSHLFLIYIKLLYLPVFQFKMKPPWTVGLHGNGVLAKQVHWFGGKWCSYLMQVESSSLLEKSFLSTKLAMVRKRSWVMQLLFQQCQLQVWSAWHTRKLIHPVQGKSVSLQMTLSSAAVCGRLHGHSSSLATQWPSHCLAAETEGGKETELKKKFKTRTDVWEEPWRDTGISNGSEKRDMKERKREGRRKKWKKPQTSKEKEE